jgi:AcrR family transcriptional regulator
MSREAQGRTVRDISRPRAQVSGGRTRGRSRRRLTAEGITAAALRIADAEGLDAVSIRRVAGEIDARPMSLYIHFDSKDELLASMANAVVAEVLLDRPLPADWREAVAAGARKMYATFVRHPWVISVFMTRPQFGPPAAAVAEQNARAVKSLSLEPAEIWSIQGAVNDYVLGHSLRASAAQTAAKDADLISEQEIAAVPELAALPEFLRSRSSVERFEFGLQTVLDGVERRVLR